MRMPNLLEVRGLNWLCVSVSSTGRSKTDLFSAPKVKLVRKPVDPVWLGHVWAEINGGPTQNTGGFVMTALNEDEMTGLADPS